MSEWDPLLSDDAWESLTRSGTATIAWHESRAGGLFAHLVKLEQGTTDAIQWQYLSHLRGRVACHILISKMPDQALPELCETLEDLYRFYVGPPAASLLLHSPTRKSVAKQGRTYRRPDIQLDEE